MPEFAAAALTVTGCFASAEAIDTIADVERVHRIALDEAIAIDESVSALQEHLRVADPTAIVLDTTDGWAAFALTGQGARQAFARLSDLRLPEAAGFVQGDVARVPVKVLVSGEGLTLLVPAMWGPYLRERFEEVIAAP